MSINRDYTPNGLTLEERINDELRKFQPVISRNEVNSALDFFKLPYNTLESDAKKIYKKNCYNYKKMD